MVYLVNNMWYPTDKSDDVAKKYFDILKKFPPDPSISKTLLILVRSNANGIHVIGIGKPEKGQMEEAFKRTVQGNEELTSIDGLRYEVQTFMDYTEAYKFIGMKAPENI